MKGTKKENILTVVVAVLALIIVVGFAYFASELKYCNKTTSDSSTDLPEIGMTEFTTLLNGDEPSIIYIARPGCTFCQRQKPIVQALATQYNLVFHYLNTDNLSSSEMSSIFKLDEKLFGEDGSEFGTPTTLIVKQGKIVDSVVGLTQSDEFVTFLTNNGLIK